MNATFDAQGRRTDAASVICTMGTVIVSYADGWDIGISNSDTYHRLTVTGVDGRTTYVYLTAAQASRLAEELT